MKKSLTDRMANWKHSGRTLASSTKSQEFKSSHAAGTGRKNMAKKKVWQIGLPVSGTVVEHSHHQPKIKGLSLATAAGTGRKKRQREKFGR